ncbi:MAG: hypothetical protein C4529_13880 [Deltaproteobacteria bacterium]|nr:MAG: hypothetical protein C4529_13880 [Deltaproteobacteria bacterium]
MKTLAAIAVLCLLAMGCAHAPPSVEVPVAVPCPAPPRVVRPHLPISDLRPTDSPDNVVRAYAASVETLIGYARELETILSGYRR